MGGRPRAAGGFPSRLPAHREPPPECFASAVPNPRMAVSQTQLARQHCPGHGMEEEERRRRMLRGQMCWQNCAARNRSPGVAPELQAQPRGRRIAAQQPWLQPCLQAARRGGGRWISFQHHLKREGRGPGMQGLGGGGSRQQGIPALCSPLCHFPSRSTQCRQLHSRNSSHTGSFLFHSPVSEGITQQLRLERILKAIWFQLPAVGWVPPISGCPGPHP